MKPSSPRLAAPAERSLRTTKENSNNRKRSAKMASSCLGQLGRASWVLIRLAIARGRRSRGHHHVEIECRELRRCGLAAEGRCQGRKKLSDALKVAASEIEPTSTLLDGTAFTLSGGNIRTLFDDLMKVTPRLFSTFSTWTNSHSRIQL